MMTEPAGLRWLLTAVFGAAALAAVLRRARAQPVQAADWAEPAFCLVMCASLIAMAWWPEPPAAARVQAAGFACAAIAFVAGWRTRPALVRLHLALMAGAMTWMLVALPGAAGTPGHDQGPMAAMPGPGIPLPVTAVSGLAAACCAAASIPWLARAIGPGLRLRDPAAAGQAAMSAGMAVMLLTML